MLGFDALGRLALAEIPRAAQTVVLSAASGVYTVAGYASGFKATGAAAPGAYLITGHAAQRVDWARSDSGAYSLTGHDATLAAKADSGSYAITGSDVLFGARFVAESGSYTLTLGNFELRRTGYDYPSDQYGIGHIKLAMEEARRRARVVRTAPYPVLRQLPLLRAPQPAPLQVAPIQGLIDNSEFIDRLAAAEQAQAEQQQAAKRMQARNRAITALLLAA